VNSSGSANFKRFLTGMPQAVEHNVLGKIDSTAQKHIHKLQPIANAEWENGDIMYLMTSGHDLVDAQRRSNNQQKSTTVSGTGRSSIATVNVNTASASTQPTSTSSTSRLTTSASASTSTSARPASATVTASATPKPKQKDRDWTGNANSRTSAATAADKHANPNNEAGTPKPWQ
jgi:hypothetical protein